MGTARAEPINQGFEKYRKAYSHRLPSLTTFSGGRVFGRGEMRNGDMDFRRGRSRPVWQKDFVAARRFAEDHPDIVFVATNELQGVLYQIRQRHNASYEDVEDGFTERRDNYDESAVTLQQLAEQVKTLKRDLKRAGVV